MDNKKSDIVPCGKCPKCLKSRQNAWAFRLSEQLKVSISSAFLTLTYNDEQLPYSFNGLPNLDKKHVQNFLKRLRKASPKSSKEHSIKYYACGEYGTKTHRPHYHMIIFNVPQSILKYPEKLEKIWSHGQIRIDPCETGSIRYVTGYIMKGNTLKPYDLDIDDRQKQFALQSQKLGLNHLTPQMVKHYKDLEKQYVTLDGGFKAPLPRYYRDKIYTKAERKNINKNIEELQTKEFEKKFDNSFKNKISWQKDQFKKHQRQQILQRSKL